MTSSTPPPTSRHLPPHPVRPPRLLARPRRPTSVDFAVRAPAPLGRAGKSFRWTRPSVLVVDRTCTRLCRIFSMRIIFFLKILPFLPITSMNSSNLRPRLLRVDFFGRRKYLFSSPLITRPVGTRGGAGGSGGNGSLHVCQLTVPFLLVTCTGEKGVAGPISVDF